MIQCLPQPCSSSVAQSQLDLVPFRLSRLLQHGGYRSRTTRRAHRSGHLPAGPCRTESFLRRAVPRTRAKYSPESRITVECPPSATPQKRPRAMPLPSPRPPCPDPPSVRGERKSKDGMMTSVALQGWLLLSLFFSLPLLGRMGKAPAGRRLDRGGGHLVRRRWGSHASAFPRVVDLLFLLWALVVSGIFLRYFGSGRGPRGGAVSG